MINYNVLSVEEHGWLSTAYLPLSISILAVLIFVFAIFDKKSNLIKLGFSFLFIIPILIQYKGVSRLNAEIKNNQQRMISNEFSSYSGPIKIHTRDSDVYNKLSNHKVVSEIVQLGINRIQRTHINKGTEGCMKERVSNIIESKSNALDSVTINYYQLIPNGNYQQKDIETCILEFKIN